MHYIAALWMLAMPVGLFAQSAKYVPYANTNMLSVDTLYVGASFLYTGASSGGGGKWTSKFGTLEPILVTLKGNEASWDGELWALVQSATGKEERVFLFNNHDLAGTTLDLRCKVSFAIPTGAEITFEYKVVAGCGGCWYEPTASDRAPKYSGPNRGNDRFRSAATSDTQRNPNRRFGNRWSVVGRTKAGDLEFGFEDCTEAYTDMDFNDVVFTVTNLEIGVFDRKLLTKDLVR